MGGFGVMGLESGCPESRDFEVETQIWWIWWIWSLLAISGPNVEILAKCTIFRRTGQGDIPL